MAKVLRGVFSPCEINTEECLHGPGLSAVQRNGESPARRVFISSFLGHDISLGDSVIGDIHTKSVIANQGDAEAACVPTPVYVVDTGNGNR